MEKFFWKRGKIFHFLCLEILWLFLGGKNQIVKFVLLIMKFEIY